MPAAQAARKLRADAQRSRDSLLEAAKDVFTEDGVEAPIRTIAARAGVGVGTLYRHFPTRGELVAAIFRREIDAVVDAADEFAASLSPVEALTAWVLRYTRFVSTKHGLRDALHSGDAAMASLPAYRSAHLEPALDRLLRAAAGAGEIRGDVAAPELLQAITSLSEPGSAEQPMVRILIDGLRTR